MASAISNTLLFTVMENVKFSQLRNTFKETTSGSISASELIRDTDVTNPNPIVPDAKDNENISKDTNLKVSQFQNSIKKYTVIQSGTDRNLDFAYYNYGDTPVDYWNSNLHRNIKKELRITGTCYSCVAYKPAASVGRGSGNIPYDIVNTLMQDGESVEVSERSICNLLVSLTSTAKIYGAAGLGGMHTNEFNLVELKGQEGGACFYINSKDIHAGAKYDTAVVTINIEDETCEVWAGGGGGGKGADGWRGANGPEVHDLTQGQGGLGGNGGTGGEGEGYGFRLGGGSCVYQNAEDGHAGDPGGSGTAGQTVTYLDYLRNQQIYSSGAGGQGGQGGDGGKGGDWGQPGLPGKDGFIGKVASSTSNMIHYKSPQHTFRGLLLEYYGLNPNNMKEGTYGRPAVARYGNSQNIYFVDGSGGDVNGHLFIAGGSATNARFSPDCMSIIADSEGTIQLSYERDDQENDDYKGGGHVNFIQIRESTNTVLHTFTFAGGSSTASISYTNPYPPTNADHLILIREANYTNAISIGGAYNAASPNSGINPGSIPTLVGPTVEVPGNLKNGPWKTVAGPFYSSVPNKWYGPVWGVDTASRVLQNPLWVNGAKWAGAHRGWNAVQLDDSGGTDENPSDDNLYFNDLMVFPAYGSFDVVSIPGEDLGLIQQNDPKVGQYAKSEGGQGGLIVDGNNRTMITGIINENTVKGRDLL